MRLIEIVHDKCVGCWLCVMICSLVKEGECSATEARIRIIRDEKFGNNLVALCTQCAEAYCVQSCPVAALARDPETGAVVVNAELCNGCEACLVACHVGAIYMDREKNIIFKCDLCGGDPECVKFCSREALVFRETDIAAPERSSFLMETSKLLALV